MKLYVVVWYLHTFWNKTFVERCLCVILVAFMISDFKKISENKTETHTIAIHVWIEIVYCITLISTSFWIHCRTITISLAQWNGLYVWETLCVSFEYIELNEKYNNNNSNKNGIESYYLYLGMNFMQYPHSSCFLLSISFNIFVSIKCIDSIEHSAASIFCVFYNWLKGKSHMK